jgi:lysine 2,3-aminomutase
MEVPMFDKSYVERMFSIYPSIKTLLQESKNVKMARFFITRYLEELTQVLNTEKSKIKPVEWLLQFSCLAAFRRILSVRSERVVKFSLLKLLWLLANERYDQLPEDLNNGFFEEMINLLHGIKGESHIYDSVSYPLFMSLQGRESALLRSEQLDEMMTSNAVLMNRYPCGLDADVQAERADNCARIRAFFKASPADWRDYAWHLRNVIRDADTLEQLIELSDEERSAISQAREAGLPFGITPFYVSLMDRASGRSRDHAVRAQVIPPLDYVEAMRAHSDERPQSLDFMMEHDTSPIDLITRRYPGIVILKPYNTCSQICVYCQRNWEIDDVLMPGAQAPDETVNAAIEWIAQHPAVNEVLITGGDPLIMSDERIHAILKQVAAIDHVERIRIGSRTPVVLPQRITPELMNSIASFHEPGRREVVLITHFEHPYEITPEGMAAVQQFRCRGMSVYNQTVFTVENSRRFELVELRRKLRLIGVDPYYTFNTKGKEETRSYRVPMARLQQEVNEEARLSPGLVRTDEPVYNVPRLGKNYVRAMHHSLLTIQADGRRVYEFHPWEKNLAMADTYIDTDVSIYDYLQELQRRGENIEDYKTIWYYY